MQSFFLSNGFVLEVEIDKERVSFRRDDVEINVDIIKGLGMYVEAEVLAKPDEVEGGRRRIQELFRHMGIPGDAITQDGYVRLMRDCV